MGISIWPGSSTAFGSVGCTVPALDFNRRRRRHDHTDPRAATSAGDRREVERPQTWTRHSRATIRRIDPREAITLESKRPRYVTLTPIQIELLKRGARGTYIGLSGDMGWHMYEVSVLGELRRAGLVEFATGPFPPGPRGLTPMIITDAGRTALASQ